MSDLVLVALAVGVILAGLVGAALPPAQRRMRRHGDEDHRELPCRGEVRRDA